MRVALVHDYIKEYGGAERVLEVLHEIWPEAPVYTSVYLPEYLGPHKERFADWKIVTSQVQKFPGIDKLISPLRVISPLIFENWDFAEFDVVIVSATGAYLPNLIVRKPNVLHVCYCHTPPRYLYGYPTARNWQKNIVGKILGEYVNHRLRQIDFISAQRPDFFIANSKEVRDRIRKFYRRSSDVIYPPVELADKQSTNEAMKQSSNKKNSYYLAGGRLARAKHIELAIAAANKLRFPLKIFGKAFAGYGEELERLAGPTVEFVGEVDEDMLRELYQNCQALIYPAEFEDFGIMPVEVQALGKPVVAYRNGGVVESVIEGKSGVFFDELTVDSLISAIKQLSNRAIKPEDCIRNAKRFSQERFKREIINFVNSKLKTSANARASTFA